MLVEKVERWFPVPGWEGKYSVSDHGRVKNQVGAPLTLRVDAYGYVVVRLADKRDRRVHRLVAMAFVLNPLNKPEVNHLDCCKTNNAASNLEWCTHAENMAHAKQHGRCPKYWLGLRAPTAQFSEEQVAEIRAAYSVGRMSWAQLARQYGANKSTIGRILMGRTYRPVQRGF